MVKQLLQLVGFVSDGQFFVDDFAVVTTLVQMAFDFGRLPSTLPEGS